MRRRWTTVSVVAGAIAGSLLVTAPRRAAA